MKEVRTAVMRPRLASLIKQSGGMYVAEALKQADGLIAQMREPLLATIDDHIADLETTLAGGVEAKALGKFYQTSTNIIALCIVEKTQAVAIAARSLCALVDEARGPSPALSDGIAVHVASIKLLHRADGEAAWQAPILAGLARVLEKQTGGLPALETAPTRR